MDVHLVDGTYELFRHYFALPQSARDDGQEIAAVRGVLNSVASMLEKGNLHIAVASDHVVESFRNQLYPHYKTGDGVPEELFSQFKLMEDSLEAMGVKVWRMIEFEADDALASAAVKAASDERVSQVVICTPDKDLSQCVVGKRVVQLDRRRDILRDEDGVIEKFGVKPESIPDYLAVVGDAADGYPGLAGWGAKAAASVFSIYPHFEDVPKEVQKWDSSIRNARKLGTTLFDNWNDAILFRTLATLRFDVPVFESIDELLWTGPDKSFESVCLSMQNESLLRRINALGAKLVKV